MKELIEQLRVRLTERHEDALAALDKLAVLCAAPSGVALEEKAFPWKGTEDVRKKEPELRVKRGRQAKALTPRKVSAAERMLGEGGSTATIRAAIAKLKPGFSRKDVTAHVGSALQDAKGRTRTAATLIDMVRRGELTRVGFGSNARYTVLRLKERGKNGLGPSPGPSEKEQAYRELRGEIRVPRDPEVEE